MGFLRVSPRLFRDRPRTSASATEYSASRSDPERLLYLGFQENVGPTLHVESRRLPKELVTPKELSCALRNHEGSVYVYATRARALRLLLVRFCLARAICRCSRAMMTRVAVEGLSAF